MQSYFEGELTVTGGEMQDVELIVAPCLGGAAQVFWDRKKPNIVTIELTNDFPVDEDYFQEFVEESAKQGWMVNGTVKYSGDSDGAVVVTDNKIEDFSVEEFAVHEYMERPDVKHEAAVAGMAVSTAAYLFLRVVFWKEDYPSTVIEDLGWVVEELLREDPSTMLLSNLRHELQEGNYIIQGEVLDDRLYECFGLEKAERIKIVEMLIKFMDERDQEEEVLYDRLVEYFGLEKADRVNNSAIE